MTETANGQANYLNVNEALARADQLMQAAVLDKDLATPPGSPGNGAAYIVGGSPTGAWSGQAGRIAYWLSGAAAWTFVTPREGWLVHVDDEDLYYKYTGSAWQILSTGGGGGTTQSVSSSSGTLNLSAVTSDTILVTLTENVAAITLPAGQSGIRKDLIIRFAQDGTGGRTVDLSSFAWEGGTPPLINSSAGAITYITASNCNNLGWDGFK